jgi:hypothetical protein
MSWGADASSTGLAPLTVRTSLSPPKYDARPEIEPNAIARISAPTPPAG